MSNFVHVISTKFETMRRMFSFISFTEKMNRFDCVFCALYFHHEYQN